MTRVLKSTFLGGGPVTAAVSRTRDADVLPKVWRRSRPPRERGAHVRAGRLAAIETPRTWPDGMLRRPDQDTTLGSVAVCRRRILALPGMRGADG